MVNFDLKKFLAEGILLKEDFSSTLEEINPDFTPDKIVTTSNYANDRGQLKSQFGKHSYDFGGSEDPVPDSIVVDYGEPQGDNEWIEFDLNKVGKFPPKKYINSTFTIDYIDNQNNLIKTILNSLENGGILVITENVGSVSDFYNKLKNNFDILEVYDFRDKGNKISEPKYGSEEWFRKHFSPEEAEHMVKMNKNHSLSKKSNKKNDISKNSVISLILKKK